MDDVSDSPEPAPIVHASASGADAPATLQPVPRVALPWSLWCALAFFAYYFIGCICMWLHLHVEALDYGVPYSPEGFRFLFWVICGVEVVSLGFLRRREAAFFWLGVAVLVGVTWFRGAWLAPMLDLMMKYPNEMKYWRVIWSIMAVMLIANVCLVFAWGLGRGCWEYFGFRIYPACLTDDSPVAREAVLAQQERRPWALTGVTAGAVLFAAGLTLAALWAEPAREAALKAFAGDATPNSQLLVAQWNFRSMTAMAVVFAGVHALVASLVGLRLWKRPVSHFCLFYVCLNVLAGAMLMAFRGQWTWVALAMALLAVAQIAGAIASPRSQRNYYGGIALLAAILANMTGYWLAPMVWRLLTGGHLRMSWAEFAANWVLGLVMLTLLYTYAAGRASRRYFGFRQD